MSAGLVDGRDLVIGSYRRLYASSFYDLFIYDIINVHISSLCVRLVAANLQKIVDEPQVNKNVTFKLVSDGGGFLFHAVTLT